MRLGVFFLHTLQQGQFNSHDLDGLLRGNLAFYREGKAVLGRILNNAPGEPDWAKEENTRQTISQLRTVLRRFNDEQGLGLKPPSLGQDFDVSYTTPAGRLFALTHLRQFENLDRWR